MKKQEPAFSYSAAYEELQQIVRALHSESVSIDDLPAAIARATELVRLCREHLRQTEEKVQDITGDLS